MSYMDDVSQQMAKKRQSKALEAQRIKAIGNKGSLDSQRIASLRDKNQLYSNTMTEVGRPSTKDKGVLEIQRLKELRNREVAANKLASVDSTPKTPFRDRVIPDSKPSSGKAKVESLKEISNTFDKQALKRRKSRKKQIRTVIRAGTDGTKSHYKRPKGHYGKSGHSRRFPPFKGLNNKEYQINA